MQSPNNKSPKEDKVKNEKKNKIRILVLIFVLGTIMFTSTEVKANEVDYHQANQSQKVYKVSEFFSADEAEDQFCSFVEAKVLKDDDLLVRLQDESFATFPYDGKGWTIVDQDGSARVKMVGSGILEFDLGADEIYNCSIKR